MLSSCLIQQQQQQRRRRQQQQQLVGSCLLALCLALASFKQAQANEPTNNINKEDQHGVRVPLELELNSMVKQHTAGQRDVNELADAIIYRLMSDNLTSDSLDSNGELDGNSLPTTTTVIQQQPAEVDSIQQELQQQPIGPQAQQLGKLVNILFNTDGNTFMSPYPVMPSGQQATMKRATMRLMQQQQQQQQAQNRISPYSRQNFDFGLGKRPDLGALNGGGVLRFGDSSNLIGTNGANGGPQAVGQLGKRPSSHRYDFGLGKRVANPTYSRYDFGLGKRAPNRIRYDFGLGK